jgi:hypothetical protein
VVAPLPLGVAHWELARQKKPPFVRTRRRKQAAYRIASSLLRSDGERRIRESLRASCAALESSRRTAENVVGADAPPRRPPWRNGKALRHFAADGFDADGVCT